MMGWMAWWILRNRSYSTSSDTDKPISKKSVIVMVLVTAILFTSVYLVTQPMCPKSEQKTIHVPAIKGETEMDSHEAYDYVVCVKQGEKP